MKRNVDKHWYIGTKNSDINIWLTSSKSNYKKWGFEKVNHGFSVHMGRTHFHMSKYKHESV